MTTPAAVLRSEEGGDGSAGWVSVINTQDTDEISGSALGTESELAKYFQKIHKYAHTCERASKASRKSTLWKNYAWTSEAFFGTKTDMFLFHFPWRY